MRVKDCPTPGKKSNRVILVSHGVVMIKFNSNIVKFFSIFLVCQYPVLIEMLMPQYNILKNTSILLNI